MLPLFARAWWHVWRKHHATLVRLTTNSDDTFEGILALRGRRRYVLAAASLYDGRGVAQPLGWTEIPRETVFCVVAQ